MSSLSLTPSSKHSILSSASYSVFFLHTAHSRWWCFSLVPSQEDHTLVVLGYHGHVHDLGKSLMVLTVSVVVRV